MKSGRLDPGLAIVALGISLMAPATRAAAPREMGLVPVPREDLLGWEKPGDVPDLPVRGELVIRKVRPLDCRVVLGFAHAPVDGRPDSWGYNGVVNEYDHSQGYRAGHWQNVTYEFVRNPGVHVTLPADGSFNYLYIRGGFEGSIYRDVDALEGPGNGVRVAEIPIGSHGEGNDFDFVLATGRLALAEPVSARRITFFRRNNLLGDVSFLHVGTASVPVAPPGAKVYHVGETLSDVSGLGLDFVRLPAAADEQHPSNFERRFPRKADRNCVDLVATGAGREMRLEPGQAVHLFTPELPFGTPIGAVRFDLVLRGVPAGNLVHLSVQDPVTGNQELIRIDVRMNVSGRIAALLDFPDVLVPRGGRFWITLASESAGTLDAGSSIHIVPAPEETARAEHLAYRLFLLKGYFQVLSEARPWTGRRMSVRWLQDYDGSEWEIQRLRPQLMDLFRTVEHLGEVAPDHPIAARQYYDWLTRRERGRIDEGMVEPVPSIEGVPRWAVLLDRTVKEVVSIPDWWLTHRMAPDGELGGFLGDDTDNLQWWVPSALLDSEGFRPRAEDAFRRIAGLVLRHNLRDGINLRVTDALHAYEEGQNQMAVLPLLCYGHPRYVEELMRAARSVEKWMVRTPEGGLRFRVNDFGWKTAMEPPGEPVDEVSDNAPLLLHSHLTLAWYNRHPRAIRTITGYLDAFDGPPPRAYGGGLSLAFGAYWLTGDAKYLYLTEGPRDARGNWWARFHPEFATHGKEAWERPWWGTYAKAVGRVSNRGDWAWAAAGDKTTLVKSLEFALYGNPYSGAGGAARYHHLWTEAEKFTDRIFIPAPVVAQPMLGGYTVRNRIWPAYAVSYEGLGGDFAALVLEQGRDRLKIALINLRDEPRRGAFRVWQLDHGEYERTTGPDDNDDGTMDAVERRETIRLARMDRVPVELPSRRLMIVRLRQTRPLDDVYLRPDLAVCSEDLMVKNGRIHVRVHNVGCGRAGSVEVSLFDGGGEELARTEAGPLDAPLDYLPRTVSVVLPAVERAAEVVIDPDGKVAELTELNNRVRLRR